MTIRHQESPSPGADEASPHVVAPPRKTKALLFTIFIVALIIVGYSAWLHRPAPALPRLEYVKETIDKFSPNLVTLRLVNDTPHDFYYHAMDPGEPTVFAYMRYDDDWGRITGGGDPGTLTPYLLPSGSKIEFECFHPLAGALDPRVVVFGISGRLHSPPASLPDYAETYLKPSRTARFIYSLRNYLGLKPDRLTYQVVPPEGFIYTPAVRVNNIR